MLPLVREPWGNERRRAHGNVFVELEKGIEGLVHISELDWTRVNKVEDVVSVGDKVSIKLFEIDKQGRLNFSIKRLKDKPE